MIISSDDFLKVNLADKKVVFTNGCFDILHQGHVDYLNKSKACGDILVVGLNTDASVKRLKGRKRPIVPESERAFILDNLKAVNYVILFEEDTPLELIKKIQPHILIKGADYSVDTVIGAKEVIANGGQVKLIDLVDGKSTSNIVQTIIDRFKEDIT